MKPFPIGGLVPWGTGKVLPILRRRQDSKYHWVYDLQGVGNMDHDTILTMIEACAVYTVGQFVVFPKMRALEVMLRHWSFKQGDVRYLIGNPRMKMSGDRWFWQAYILKHRLAEGEEEDLESVF